MQNNGNDFQFHQCLHVTVMCKSLNIYSTIVLSILIKKSFL